MIETKILTLAELEQIALVLENESKFYSDYIERRADAPGFAREALRTSIRYYKNSFSKEVAKAVMSDAAEWWIEREILRRYFDEQYGIYHRSSDANSTAQKRSAIDLPKLYGAEPKSAPQPEQPKEQTMNAATTPIEVTTKTFVNGVDIASMSDSGIYDLIASQEAKIKELNLIETKPKKLLAEIQKRADGIKALVDYLDSKQ